MADTDKAEKPDTKAKATADKRAELIAYHDAKTPEEKRKLWKASSYLQQTISEGNH